ncbi:MAG: isoprenylcysteine carboxylmethyltransferase family protein [Saprospiraceae bacterium]|jgi:protein-S-isoprenylcysteine O-methyltransferase Ste14|nr:isoprenylcysteine carboxylmethyltransferase family protein [Saprospiraceae bacterium]MBK8052998.1 isoprenylcysteine carboxylmethyltransferase family protein [Saprospiraceae bacterium]MBK8373139.1 isoprenylcysteine carboxylmethyltransferase family protein [Saprospiraceae bacterium]MBK8547758.1 isoprenylcysteine carboxylmethyltransferase family protein [Saprospiraceae bacterium]MBK8854895.1 isoprenylcysteine carboxylmethyltransferase family protein [Saprospiraceae bacterium]
MALKIYLPIYLIMYMLVAFVIPTYRTYKQTGINPITFGKNDNAHDYIGFIMKVLIVLLFVAVLTYSMSEKMYSYLVPISYLQTQILTITGLALIHIALVWISIAQFQMSNSWRIGIDEENKTKLVTDGVFLISRNPIFLGMIISVLGLFFIVPNALTFFLTITTYIIIQIQIRLEEEFLQKQHAQDYVNYKLKTKRLL